MARAIAVGTPAATHMCAHANARTLPMWPDYSQLRRSEMLRVVHNAGMHHRPAGVQDSRLT